MPEYTFLFDPAASGLDYTITNRAGVEVEDGTLETDADSVEVTVDLPWGDYVARAETASGPYLSTRTFYANGTSIAAGGGGGGVVVDGESIVFEVNNGVTLNVSGTAEGIIWDTAPVGFTPGGELELPDGLYMAQMYIDLDTFADDLVATLGISDQVLIQPLHLASTSGFARTLQVSGALRVFNGVTISATAGFALADTGTTETVDISYASLALTPFTPAS